MVMLKGEHWVVRCHGRREGQAWVSRSSFSKLKAAGVTQGVLGSHLDGLFKEPAIFDGPRRMKPVPLIDGPDSHFDTFMNEPRAGEPPRGVAVDGISGWHHGERSTKHLSRTATVVDRILRRWYAALSWLNPGSIWRLSDERSSARVTCSTA